MQVPFAGDGHGNWHRGAEPVYCSGQKLLTLKEKNRIRDDAVYVNERLIWFSGVREDREDRIINDLVSSVRSRKATFEQLWGGILAIAELRSLEIDLESQLRESVHKAEQELGNAR